MRAAPLALLIAGLWAAAAAAQPLTTTVGPGLQSQLDLQSRLNALDAQQDLARREAVIRENRAAAVEAQARAERAVADVRAQAATPRAPAPPASGPPAHIDTRALASIPDAALAESDARVRAAADNRH
jgi:hypothetical protein